MIKKICLLLCLCCAFLISGCGSTDQTPPVKKTPADYVQKVTGISQEEANAAVEVLKAVGITNFEDIDILDKEKHSYYTEEDKYGKVPFIIENGKVTYIGSQDGVIIYNPDQGQIATLEEVYLTNDEKANFQIMAEKVVKAKLLAPSTTDFNDINVQRNKSGVLVSGSLDAQNGYGAMLRKAFMVTINYDTKQVVTVDIL